MRAHDLIGLAGFGLRTRKLRTSLAGLGITLGIASLVAVLGLSASSRADLIAALDRLGTNLLTLAPGSSFAGEATSLPETAGPMIGRLRLAEATTTVQTLEGVNVLKSDRIPREETGGIVVAAADPGLPEVLRTPVAAGAFLTEAIAGLPVVALGSVAAERLGVSRIGTLVWLGERWFAVVGILDAVPLDPLLDRTAFIGYEAASSYFGSERSPTTVYVRTRPKDVLAAGELAARAANPEHPERVQVQRPSDALEARFVAQETLTSLFLALGAVGLIVGGFGIANLMVVSVLERRSEIGLRRALGATKRHVAAQFFLEALLLAAIGGCAGAALGSLVTAAIAFGRGWEVVVPPGAVVASPAVAVVVGGIAGLYPALRAAATAPADALRGT